MIFSKNIITDSIISIIRHVFGSHLLDTKKYFMLFFTIVSIICILSFTNTLSQVSAGEDGMINHNATIIHATLAYDQK